MVALSPAYEPAMLKGLTVHKDNPFQFDFIVDAGQERLTGQALKQETEELVKYFLASLAIPGKDLWVNLSPYEKDRIIPEALGQTGMGRDLLAQDYILKQITSSLIYPGKDLGRKFWDSVYAKARQQFGSAPVPVDTFNKVWITADKAEVFERDQTAFVVKSHLKVMLEEDYLAAQKHERAPAANRTKEIIKQIILPELEREVNTGRNFAKLRQITNSLILAGWFKNNLKQALLNQLYANQEKVNGIDLRQPGIRDQIYERYLQAYKKGVFNFIKEEAGANGASIPRKYFSGGWNAKLDANPEVTHDTAMLGGFRKKLDGLFSAVTNLVQPSPALPVTVVPVRAMFSSGEGMSVNQLKQAIVNLEMDLNPHSISEEHVVVGRPYTELEVSREVRQAQVLMRAAAAQFGLEPKRINGHYQYVMFTNQVLPLRRALEKLEKDLEVINAKNFKNPDFPGLELIASRLEYLYRSDAPPTRRTETVALAPFLADILELKRQILGRSHLPLLEGNRTELWRYRPSSEILEYGADIRGTLVRAMNQKREWGIRVDRTADDERAVTMDLDSVGDLQVWLADFERRLLAEKDGPLDAAMTGAQTRRKVLRDISAGLTALVAGAVLPMPPATAQGLPPLAVDRSGVIGVYAVERARKSSFYFYFFLRNVRWSEQTLTGLQKEVKNKRLTIEHTRDFAAGFFRETHQPGVQFGLSDKQWSAVPEGDAELGKEILKRDVLRIEGPEDALMELRQWVREHEPPKAPDGGRGYGANPRPASDAAMSIGRAGMLVFEAAVLIAVGAVAMFATGIGSAVLNDFWNPKPAIGLQLQEEARAVEQELAKVTQETKFDVAEDGGFSYQGVVRPGHAVTIREIQMKLKGLTDGPLSFTDGQGNSVSSDQPLQGAVHISALLDSPWGPAQVMIPANGNKILDIKSGLVTIHNVLKGGDVWTLGDVKEAIGKAYPGLEEKIRVFFYARSPSPGPAFIEFDPKLWTNELRNRDPMGGQVLRIQMEGVPADVAEKLIEFIVDRINATQPKPDAALLAPSAEKRQGGIDLKNIAPTVRKEGRGVQMNMDPAMLERIKREGIDGLTPVIDRISPVQSIWPLVGLEPPN